MQEVTITLVADKGARLKEGRYGYLMECAGKEVTGRGREKDTTRNRLCLLALTHALARMTRPAAITVVTDNAYLVGSHARLHEWQQAGWKNSRGDQIANADLWQQVYKSQKVHAIRITLGSPAEQGFSIG